MNDSGKSAELTKVEAVVQSSLLPTEELLRICQERDKRDMFVNVTSLGTFYACMNMAMMNQIDGTFIPATWKRVFLLLTEVILIAGFIAFGITTFNLEHHHPMALGDILWLFIAVLVIHIAAFIMVKRRAFAITNKRIVYLTLPDARIRGWISLGNLSAVEVNKNKNGNWMKLKFSSRPTGMDGKLVSDKQEIYLSNFDQPDQVKSVLDGLIKSSS